MFAKFAFSLVGVLVLAIAVLLFFGHPGQAIRFANYLYFGLVLTTLLPLSNEKR